METIVMHVSARKGETGREITLDISDASCLKFGFKHGDRVLTPRELRATIMGVALSNEGDYVLWYLIDGLQGVCYYGDSNRNLLETGFKKLME